MHDEVIKHDQTCKKCARVCAPGSGVEARRRRANLRVLAAGPPPLAQPMRQRQKSRRRVYAENAIDAVDEAAVLERDLYRHLVELPF